MSTVADRLSLYEAVLALIEKKRAETGDEFLGSAIERVILDTQFRDLEGEIMETLALSSPG